MENFSFGFEEKPLSQTTIQELDAMVLEMFNKRAEAEKLEDEASKLSAQVEVIKAKVMNILEATGRLNHETPGCGKVYTQTKYQVTFPKEQESADIFRSYLRSIGADAMLTMNHMTLNAFFKSKLEEAGEGADPSKVLPGVGKPEERIVLAMKKGK